MQARHTDRRRYFMEEAVTTEKYFIPYISRLMKVEGIRVLEVGCGEGGNLLPFSRRGCRVTGVDVCRTRVCQARDYFSQECASGLFVCGDILDFDCQGCRFDLVIMHDVVEHISAKEAVLAKIGGMLASGGMVFVAFPAWQMPFGGHQQIARSRVVSRMPFIHLLPRRVYRRLLRLCGEDDFTVGELMSIRRTRCTVEMFRRAVRRSGYSVKDMRLWLVNPHYETKFGLRPLALPGIVASVPFVRNFLATSCFWLISKPGAIDDRYVRTSRP